MVVIHVQIPPSHVAYEASPVPVPERLKRAILRKHTEWLEANKTGDVAIAEPVDDELYALENQAKE